MKGLSSWTITSLEQLKQASPIQTLQAGMLQFVLLQTRDSVWVAASYKNAAPIYFNTCPVPAACIKKLSTRVKDNTFHITIDAVMGRFLIKITFGKGAFTWLNYSCCLIPKIALYLPFCPRDILTANSTLDGQKSWGVLHLSQIGTRSGLAYFTKEQSRLRVLYVQNLTALSNYAEQTSTSMSGVVSGQLPEIGLSLPSAIEKPLRGGIKTMLSDAYICFQPLEREEKELSLNYLELLAAVYLILPRPKTRYLSWPGILKKGLKDLIENPGCWSMVGGNSYLNAYVSDYNTPPEIMVQLAVLLPLVDYVEWSGEKLDVVKKIKTGLPAFYNKKLNTIVRWHPAAEDKLTGEEEQKLPMVMDSWYLHHPLLNLSRLAIKGDHEAEKLFLDSIGYAIKVAHAYKYEWPVFYKMDTLEIIKAETSEGKGGEQDVAGLYAHVMLQAYELTGDQKYLQEAERAAKKLSSLGMEIMYQANNTAFAAGALLKLYKLTGKQIYLNLSYRCLASIFQNVQLWDCGYGLAKHFPTFFALFPLADAPYTAAYEEQEVFCALHDYLQHAEGITIEASVRLLCAEYIRYLVDRAAYYYPPMLPKEVISKEVKTGEVDPDLWIALEDLQDGLKQSGSVGQEVYGAGNAFGILPRHFIRPQNECFLIFTDYPFAALRKSEHAVDFHLLGDKRLDCSVRIVSQGDQDEFENLDFQLKGAAGKFQTAKGKKNELEATVKGDARLQINWKSKNEKAPGCNPD
ncbi:hypothetical protein [Pedobacter miscanthi]|uniref:Uncharacterized protein n=1 Tax=Pedobacter miscanthi TaxID=2259170 RepID=A0A366LE48_9SPHI|nr:hypothetical protein [Pedobacter miscanthi]RBQ11779.1 hypothetical protein DRW42_00440 [Pedobacter miscanthi]